MTTEIEKTFFDTFGIEPKKEYYCPSCDTKLEEWKTEKGLYYMCGNCCECDYVLDSLDEEFAEILKNLSYRTEYPQISDRIYLELHCLLNRLDAPPYGLTVKEFKKDILISAIGVLSRNETANRIDNIKHQVRTLFEEGNNDNGR